MKYRKPARLPIFCLNLQPVICNPLLVTHFFPFNRLITSMPPSAPTKAPAMLPATAIRMVKPPFQRNVSTSAPPMALKISVLANRLIDQPTVPMTAQPSVMKSRFFEAVQPCSLCSTQAVMNAPMAQAMIQPMAQPTPQLPDQLSAAAIGQPTAQATAQPRLIRGTFIQILMICSFHKA